MRCGLETTALGSVFPFIYAKVQEISDPQIKTISPKNYLNGDNSKDDENIALITKTGSR